jgi:hypothetical protein
MNEDERFVFGRERKCRDWKMKDALLLLGFRKKKKMNDLLLGL